MRSMTGYGRAQTEFGTDLITLELTSVNKKNLEVVFSGPREWQSFEIQASKEVTPLVGRGRIRISVTVESSPNEHPALFKKVQIDEDFKQLKDLMKNYGQELVAKPEIFIELLRLRNTKDTQTANISDVSEILGILLHRSLKGFLKMKEVEGDILKKDMTKRVAVVSDLTEKIHIESQGMANEWKKKLLLRLQNSGLELDVNDERVLKEVSLFSEKSDISEEITRLESHILQLQATFSQIGNIGRKIEFLLQEVGRELNTICSKSTKIECTQLALDARCELEKLREQVLNIE